MTIYAFRCLKHMMSWFREFVPAIQCDQIKSPNVSKSCPKMISLEKWMILTPLQKLSNNVGNLGKIIVATCFEWLPKVQKSPNLVTLLPYYNWHKPISFSCLLEKLLWIVFFINQGCHLPDITTKYSRVRPNVFKHWPSSKF